MHHVPHALLHTSSSNWECMSTHLHSQLRYRLHLYTQLHSHLWYRMYLTSLGRKRDYLNTIQIAMLFEKKLKCLCLTKRKRKEKQKVDKKFIKNNLIWPIWINFDVQLRYKLVCLNTKCKDDGRNNTLGEGYILNSIFGFRLYSTKGIPILRIPNHIHYLLQVP